MGLPLFGVNSPLLMSAHDKAQLDAAWRALGLEPNNIMAPSLPPPPKEEIGFGEYDGDAGGE